MLWKPDPITIDQEDPFAEDRLDRKSQVEDIGRLIRESPEPIVLAVDGPWGSGKTTFLKFLRAHLAPQHPTVFFNAWRIDFVDDPLLPLVAELSERMEELGVGGDDGTSPVENIKKYGGALLKRGVPALIKAGTHGVVDAEEFGPAVRAAIEEAGGEAAELAEQHLESYRDTRSALESFRAALGELVSSIDCKGEDTEQVRSRPLVIFVDELDRCRPDFALSFLERIKHAFSVPGVTFVLGLNQRELAKSVRAVYGSSFNASRYLNRLIDLRYQLPEQDPEDYIAHLVNASGVFDQLDRRGHGRGDPSFGTRGVLNGLTAKRVISLRVLEKIVGRISVILRVTPTRTSLAPLPLVFLVAVRQTLPETYEDFVQGRIGAGELLGEVDRLPGGPLEYPENVGAILRAQLYLLSNIPGESSERLTELRARYDEMDIGQNPEEAGRVEAEIRALDDDAHRPERLQLLAERIELSRRFH